MMITGGRGRGSGCSVSLRLGPFSGVAAAASRVAAAPAVCRGVHGVTTTVTAARAMPGPDLDRRQPDLGPAGAAGGPGARRRRRRAAAAVDLRRAARRRRLSESLRGRRLPRDNRRRYHFASDS